MTDEEYRNAVLNVVYLAACAVDERRPDPSRVMQMDLNTLYDAADRHMLTGITAIALEMAGMRDESFTQAKGNAIRKAAMFDMERAAVLEKLEEAGIWYMPLKGCVLQDYFPKLGMRQMSDNDILYDLSRSKDVRSIMERLGYETVQFIPDSFSHDIYMKAPVYNFEMHRALFDRNAGDVFFQYYSTIRDKLIKDENNRCGFHLSPEDFYIFMIAHEYKHFSGSGTGVRSLLDTYVLIKKKGAALNWPYIISELDTLGLKEFEAQNRSLSTHLFKGDDLTAAESDMLNIILFSGTYGTTVNRVRNGIIKSGNGTGGKIRYFFSRVFIPMDSVRVSFPLFGKYPILLPFLPVYRLLRGLTVRRKQMRAEIKALVEYKDDM